MGGELWIIYSGRESSVAQESRAGKVESSSILNLIVQPQLTPQSSIHHHIEGSIAPETKPEAPEMRL